MQAMQRTITEYESTDGKIFSTQKKCEDHEIYQALLATTIKVYAVANNKRLQGAFPLQNIELFSSKELAKLSLKNCNQLERMYYVINELIIDSGFILNPIHTAKNYPEYKDIK